MQKCQLLLWCSLRTGARAAWWTIDKEGFPDAVVWNPWTDKAKGMSDFGDDEYKVQSSFVLSADWAGWPPAQSACRTSCSGLERLGGYRV